MITLEPPRSLAARSLAESGLAVDADHWRALGISRVSLSRFLSSACAAVGLKGNVDVLLADDRTLRRLNRQFRGKDKPTDVLSFPAIAEVRAIHAGDLAISLETAQRQAAEHGHTLGKELRVLLLHGLLHLGGMDHEADRGEMAEREAVLRSRMRLPAGLIARTHTRPIQNPAKAKDRSPGREAKRVRAVRSRQTRKVAA